jgi:hypothetical protein
VNLNINLRLTLGLPKWNQPSDWEGWESLSVRGESPAFSPDLVKVTVKGVRVSCVICCYGKLFMSAPKASTLRPPDYDSGSAGEGRCRDSRATKTEHRRQRT